MKDVFIGLASNAFFMKFYAGAMILVFLMAFGAVLNILRKSSHLLFSTNPAERHLGINHMFSPHMRLATNTMLLLMVITIQMFGFMILLVTIGKSTPS